MFSDVQFDELIESVYDAALSPADWRHVVDKLTKGFDAIGASVYTPFSYRAKLEPIWSTNADPAFIAEYASRYANGDVLSRALWKHVPLKSLVYCWDDIVSRAELESWDGYHDLLKPRGVLQGIGLLAEAEDHRAGQLMIYVPEWPVSQINAAKQVFQRVSSHLSRAMHVHWHLMSSNQIADASKMTLDMFKSGVVWLSAAGEVLYMNAAMNSLLDVGSGVRLMNGKLRLDHPREVERLNSAIDGAKSNKETSFSIGRTKELSPLHMTVFPLPMQATALRFPQAVAIGFISDTISPGKSNVDMVQAVYRLTSAELRVLEQLLKGMDARAISLQLGTSENTVRTQIRSLLSKCGVTRQADLIRLVAMLPQVCTH